VAGTALQVKSKKSKGKEVKGNKAERKVKSNKTERIMIGAKEKLRDITYRFCLFTFV
jgi:hypothetical protein